MPMHPPRIRATQPGQNEAVTSSIVTTATARDGTPLLLRRWAADPAWASVLLVHGLAEHSGRYERAGSLLAAAGLDVQAFDLRGYGESGGLRAHVERWSVYLDDVADRLAAVRIEGRPTVLFGHSMGALVCLTYAVSDRPAPDALVLSTPPLDARLPPVPRTAVPLLSAVLPRLRLSNPITGDQLSSDPSVGERYFADPLLEPRSTARLAAEALGAMRTGRDGLRRLTVPTYVTHGEADTIVPVDASEPLAHVPGVERHTYPVLRHETLNEPQGPQVVAGIVAWLRRTLAAS